MKPLNIFVTLLISLTSLSHCQDREAPSKTASESQESVKGLQLSDSKNQWSLSVEEAQMGVTKGHLRGASGHWREWSLTAEQGYRASELYEFSLIRGQYKNTVNIQANNNVFSASDKVWRGDRVKLWGSHWELQGQSYQLHAPWEKVRLQSVKGVYR